MGDDKQKHTNGKQQNPEAYAALMSFAPYPVAAETLEPGIGRKIVELLKHAVQGSNYAEPARELIHLVVPGGEVPELKYNPEDNTLLLASGSIIEHLQGVLRMAAVLQGQDLRHEIVPLDDGAHLGLRLTHADGRPLTDKELESLVVRSIYNLRAVMADAGFFPPFVQSTYFGFDGATYVLLGDRFEVDKVMEKVGAVFNDFGAMVVDLEEHEAASMLKQRMPFARFALAMPAAEDAFKFEYSLSWYSFAANGYGEGYAEQHLVPVLCNALGEEWRAELNPAYFEKYLEPYIQPQQEKPKRRGEGDAPTAAERYTGGGSARQQGR